VYVMQLIIGEQLVHRIVEQTKESVHNTSNIEAAVTAAAAAAGDGAIMRRHAEHVDVFASC